MRNVKRYFKPGNTYFLTHVTFNRMPILIDNFEILWNAIQKVKKDYNYDLIAWVVLHDHMHLIINPLKNDLSGLMRKIKLSFSGKLRHKLKIISGRIWQNRFWDHIIRDEKDFKHHIDYIHYNPVKHRLVMNPKDYSYSSFNDFLTNGLYDEGWGIKEELVFDGAYGE